MSPETNYYDPDRCRFYVDRTRGGEWLVMREVPGNTIIVCHTVHGQPDAEMVVDALNFWQDRHKRRAKENAPVAPQSGASARTADDPRGPND